MYWFWCGTDQKSISISSSSCSTSLKASSLSLVSKARTAFHSTAAKAEKVFTDIKKSDSLTNQDSIGEVHDDRSPSTSNSNSPNNGSDSKTRHDVKYWTRKPHPLKTKQDWHEGLKNVGKKRADDFEKPGNSTMSFAIFDENLYLMGMRDVSEANIKPIPLSLCAKRGHWQLHFSSYSNRFESELEGLDCSPESIASQT